MAETVMVNKVTLSTGKVVLLREMLIKHTELAAQAAAPRAGGNETLLNLYMQKEVIKMLIVSINDKPVKQSEIEDLDKHFNMLEYTQLTKVVSQIMGVDDIALGKFQLEVVSTGDK